MKRMSKKLLAVFLALSVVCTMSGMTALATEGEAYTPVDEADADDAREESDPAEEFVGFDSPVMVSEIKAEAESAADEAEAVSPWDTETEDSEFLLATEERSEDTAGERAAAAAGAAAETEPDGLPEPGSAAPAEDEAAAMPPLDEQTLPAKVRPGCAGLTAVSSAGSSFTLSGVMPEGAFVEAEPVKAEMEGITVLSAFDITIRDADGNAYQPQDGPIRVHIENEAIRNAENEGRHLFVFHMKDVNAEPEEVPVIMAENGSLEFDADSFSIYIVGADFALFETDGETEHYVYTVNFYLGDSDGNALLSSQTVSPGERVEQPAVPDHENYTFAGWYSEPGGGGERYDFYYETLSEITDGRDHEINLYAHYNEIYYVHFMTHAHEEGDGDTSPVFHIEGLTRDQVLDTETAERLYLAEGYLSYTDEVTGELITAFAVTGWKDLSGNFWKTGDPIDWDAIGGGPLVLYPVVEGACWVYFSMNGQAGVENPAPAYVLASETMIGDLPAPSVSGYTLDGWYTAAEGGERVTGETLMTSLPKNADGSVTLYAHWSAGRVAYTINIWRQKAIDGAAGVAAKEIVPGETYEDYIQYYDYAESHYVSAEQSRLYTGDTPTTDRVDNWSVYTGYATTTNSDSAYYGFEYAASGNVTTSANRTLNDLAAKTMAADGSTIINIFYNRVTVMWTFNSSFGQGGSGIQTGTLIGLYDTNVVPADGVGAGTLSDWPSAGTNYIWQTSVKPYTFEARFRLLNNAVSSTFTPYNFNNANKPVYYYLEVTNESKQVDPDGEKAAEARKYGISYTKTVEGTPYVFVRRLMVQSSLDITSKFIGYEYVGYNVTDSGSTFTGTGSNIPTSSNQCFIFNNANPFTITLLSSKKVVGVNDAGEAVETGRETTWTVKYGEDLSRYIFPASLDPDIWGPAYYCGFTGIWYEDPSLTAPFTASTMPNNNLVAYADWKLRDITVTFVTGTPDVEAPEAQLIKATSAAADPGTLEREGYLFVGWVDQNGEMFNFNTKLYADTTLTAIWKSEGETGCQMHYNLNAANSNGLLDPGDFPDGTDVFTDSDHFVTGDYEDIRTIEQTFDGLGEDVYKAFIGWNTRADGSGTMYYPYGEIYVGGELTLYAVWAHEKASTLILVHNYPAGYTGGTADNTLTQSNLTAVDLQKESGLAYHDEITLTGADGSEHVYRFDGWSTAMPGSDPTDRDVDVAADALVAVDTLATGTGNVNYLYAVWLEVYRITVTKEVVDNAVNHTVPEGQTFNFVWSFVDGEGTAFSNEGIVEIGDGESFVIDGVASGERVTITETPAAGFSTSYNGAHTDVADDGSGTCSFTMDENSQEITVYNTVETGGELTVTKVWDDNGNKYGKRPESVTVQLTADGKTAVDRYGSPVGAATLCEDNGWTATFEDLYKYSDGSEIVYSVEEQDGDPFYEMDEVRRVTAGDGTYFLEVVNTLSMEFYPMDEEIVPGGDGEAAPDSWVSQESVNEYEAIQIEMSTTLPRIQGELLDAETIAMTFHSRLDSPLVPDASETDFIVDINGQPVDSRYYSIETSPNNSLNRLRLLQLLNLADDCSFHVSVDLSALYRDRVIDEDDLGTGTVRIFFCADLETEEVSGFFSGTAWYDVADGGDVLYTSGQSEVSVYTFEIMIDKYDTETKEALAGADFGLYRDGECLVAVSRSGENYTAATDENGQTKFTGIAEGTYYVKEMEAPVGYDLSDEILPVTLSGPADGGHIVEVSYGNTPTSEDQPAPEDLEDPEQPDEPKDPEQQDDPGGPAQTEDEEPGGPVTPGGTDSGNSAVIPVDTGKLSPDTVKPPVPEPVSNTGAITGAAGDGGTGDTGNTDTPNATAVVKTADTNVPVLYLLLIMAAGAAAAVLIVWRRTAR